MSAKQIKRLRILVMIVLGLLIVQYEFGIAFNISNPPSLPAFSFSDGNAFNQALNRVGFVAQAHSIVGFLIWLVVLVNLVLSLRSKMRSVQIFGSLLFLSITVAGVAGSIFVASGFNDDHASHAMASNFILSYTFAFLELYFLKGDPGPQRTKTAPASD